MTGRVCTGCRQEFGPLRPPVEPVELREGEPGHLVPRLRITLHGQRCAACARDQVPTLNRRAK